MSSVVVGAAEWRRHDTEHCRDWRQPVRVSADVPDPLGHAFGDLTAHTTDESHPLSTSRPATSEIWEPVHDVCQCPGRLHRPVPNRHLAVVFLVELNHA